MAKLTAEQKAKNAQVMKEREAREAAQRANASLDSCEGASPDKHELMLSSHAWELKNAVEESGKRYRDATRDLAKRAAELAESAEQDQHPFYTGAWFARRGAEIEAMMVEYKAALLNQKMFARLFPNVKPTWE